MNGEKPKEPMTFGQRIAAARLHAGLNQSQLARAVKVKPQAIQAIEDPKRNIQTSKFTSAIAEATGVNHKWLALGVGEMLPEPHATTQHVVVNFPRHHDDLGGTTGRIGIDSPRVQVDAEILGWYAESIPEGRVALLALARGGTDQEMFVQDGPIGYMAIPPVLLNVPRGYAMRVIGDSMEPMYYERTVIFVNPNREPIRHEGVVIWKQNDAILLKQFIRFTPAGVLVREYQPELREFEVPSSEIRQMHVVVGTDTDRRL